MATTRYVVAATPSADAKVLSNLKSARREADLRAKSDRVDVTVTTLASGRITYTAQGAPLVTPETLTTETPQIDELITEVRQEADMNVAEVLNDITPEDTEGDEPQNQTAPCGCEIQSIIATGSHSTGCPKAVESARQTRAISNARPKKSRTPARRKALGPASVAGWELLYDKPRHQAEVARSDGRYALICKKHAYVHPMAKLVEDRQLLRQGGWCAECTH